MTSATPGSVDAISTRKKGATRLGVSPAPTWVINTVVLLAMWQIASLLAGRTMAGAHMVPSLPDIAVASKLLGNYWPGGLGLMRTAEGADLTWRAALYAFFYNSGLTLFRVFVGFALGILLGVGLAAAVSWSTVLRKAMVFPAHIARMLPLLALVPLFNLWLGDTETAAVLFVALVTFCVIFATALAAIAAVPDYFMLYGASLGAGRAWIYWSIVLPAAMPRIAVGILLAHGFAWGGGIAAEFLGMQYGIGRIVLMAQQFNQFNLLAVAAFITVGLSVGSYALLSYLFRSLIRWR
jgi:ABC-type nitrate/sulfonate/bicarbonate transport system permease component